MESVACPNCGSPVERRFCPECGQEQKPSVAPLCDLLPDLLEEFLKFDSRLFSSLSLLIARPGFLTTAFLAAKRARYLTPIKLYFSMSFAFFCCFSSPARIACFRRRWPIPRTRIGFGSGFPPMVHGWLRSAFLGVPSR